jgi:nitroreductase
MITRREANIGLLSTLTVAATPTLALAQAQVQDLPPPQVEGGKSLMQALKARHSTRAYLDRPLPMQVLSNLVWAAWGINRPTSGLRTAPSSHSIMDIDLYFAMASGVWLYDPKAHRLTQYMPDDLRGATTTGQDFVKVAALNIIYVSDAARMGKVSDADRMLNGVADSAVIAQNVYLFCASEGLGAVLRASVPGVALAKRLGLSPTQAIYFAQSVGYPKTDTL